MIDATDRQKEILKFVKDFIDTNKFSPSFREICSEFDITPRTVQDHLNALERKGFIQRKLNTARAIVVK